MKQQCDPGGWNLPKLNGHPFKLTLDITLQNSILVVDRICCQGIARTDGSPAALHCFQQTIDGIQQITQITVTQALLAKNETRTERQRPPRKHFLIVAS
jgi:hypothetical protein